MISFKSNLIPVNRHNEAIQLILYNWIVRHPQCVVFKVSVKA